MDFSRPELEMLVLLSRMVPKPEEKQRISKFLSADLKWDDLFSLAYAHGVFPLVYKNLQDNNFPPWSENEAERWKQVNNSIRMRGLYLTAELTNVLKYLQQADISAIPLKGPILSHLLYGDIGYRMFTDLDILVHQDTVDLALRTLVGRGYLESEDRSAHDSPYAPRARHHYTLVKGGQVQVELHHTLEPPYFSTSGNTEAFWESVKSLSLFGITVTMPSNEELLLFLCRHGSRHLWRSLKWLADIAQFLDAYRELNWNYILMRAKDTRTTRLVFLGLYLASKMYSCDIPREINEEIEADRRLVNLGSQILIHLFNSQTSLASLDPEIYVDEQLLLIQLREGSHSATKVYLLNACTTQIAYYGRR